MNYSSTCRYIKLRTVKKNAHNRNGHNAQNKSARNTHNSKGKKESKPSDHSNTEEDSSDNSVDRKSERNEKGHFQSGNKVSVGNPGNPNPQNQFQQGNTASRKHGGYAARFDDQSLFDEAADMSLIDELELCRARALNCIDTMKKIRADMANAGSVETRLELYSAMLSTESALDRNVGRVESLTKTISSLRIDVVNEVKISKDTDRIQAATRKLRLEADKLAKDGRGSDTPISAIINDLHEMGSDGLMSHD